VENTRLQELREFLPAIDQSLQRFFPFEIEELRDSGDKLSAYNVRGYASVYDSWSLDLGGFRERVMPEAFDEVLGSESLAVAHVWDHDTSKILSATWNDTLTLSSDTHGLQFYSRVAKTDYAKDLRVLLERRDIKEASFAFTVGEGGDEWRVVEEEDGTEIIERDILKVDGLYDVTTCAMGAYPATSSALALRSIVRGRSPAVRAMLVAQVQDELEGKRQEVAPDDSVGTPQASEEDAAAQESVVEGDLEAARTVLAELRSELEALQEREERVLQSEAEEAERAEHEQRDSAESEAERKREEFARWKAETAEQHRQMRRYVNRVEGG
jgi:uncharacterized protein